MLIVGEELNESVVFSIIQSSKDSFGCHLQNSTIIRINNVKLISYSKITTKPYINPQITSETSTKFNLLSTKPSNFL